MIDDDKDEVYNVMTGQSKQWLSSAMERRPQTPCGEVGRVAISKDIIPAYKSIPLVSLRNAIFMGEEPCNVMFDEDMVVRTLQCADHGAWMTDSPQEVWQMRHALGGIGSKQTVLVGGLGLGVFSTLCADQNNYCVTVENNNWIIELVDFEMKYNIWKTDIDCAIRNVKPGMFDYAFLDTWQSTGEHCWITEVIPLRRALRPHVKNMWCWNENEMIGQFVQSAFRCISLPKHHLWGTHNKLLRTCAEQIGGFSTFENITDPKQLVNELFVFEMENRNNEKLIELVSALVEDVGSEAWERRFGDLWDEIEENDNGHQKGD